MYGDCSTQKCSSKPIILDCKVVQLPNKEVTESLIEMPLLQKFPAENIEKTLFETLLLNSISSKAPIKNKRKMVAPGAEVITCYDVIERMKNNVPIEKKIKPLQDKTNMQKKVLKPIKVHQNKKKHEPMSSEEDLSWTSSDESEDNMQDYINDLLGDEENDPSINMLNISMFDQFDDTAVASNSEMLEIGKWIVVQFATKKTVKHFVGVIIKLEQDDRILTKFARKLKTIKKENETMFSFPRVEDIYEVKEEDVICILPQPSTGRRGEIIFKTKISGYNIQ